MLEPRVYVFSRSVSPVRADSKDTISSIEIKEDGFLVRSVPTIPPDTKTFLLNEEGKSYIYLALAE